jgi:hypothetical protein
LNFKHNVNSNDVLDKKGNKKILIDQTIEMKINQKLQGVNISTINQKTIHAQYFNNI